MTMRFDVTNNHGSNSYSVITENTTTSIIPTESVSGYVNDEYVETFLANLQGQPGVDLRVFNVAHGEEYRMGRANITISASTSEIAAATLKGVADLYVTCTAVISATISGLGGGSDGRVIRIHNKTSGLTPLLVLGHLAGSPTPSGSRLFINGLAGLTLVSGASVEAVYHGGDNLWYVG